MYVNLIKLLLGTLLLFTFTSCGDSSSSPTDPVKSNPVVVATLSSPVTSVDVYVGAVENFTVDAKTASGTLDEIRVVSSNTAVLDVQVFASTVSITAKSVGTATITVTSDSGKSLQVSVNVLTRDNSTIDKATPYTLGTVLSRTNSDERWYSFPVVADNVYEISYEVSNSTGTLYSTIYGLDNTDHIISPYTEASDGYSISAFKAHDTGTYHLKINSYSQMDIKVMIVNASADNTSSGASTLVLNQLQNGLVQKIYATLDVNETIDWYKISVEADKTYTFSVHSYVLSSLYSGDDLSTPLRTGNSYNLDNNLTYKPSSTGELYLKIESGYSSVMQYTVLVSSSLDPVSLVTEHEPNDSYATAETIVVGVDNALVLNNAGMTDYDYLKFIAKTSTRYTITLSQPGGDSDSNVGALLVGAIGDSGASGILQGSNTDYGSFTVDSGSDALIYIQIRNPGSTSAEGDYKITVEESGPTPAVIVTENEGSESNLVQLSVNTSHNGTIGASSDSVKKYSYYTFTSQDAGDYVITTSNYSKDADLDFTVDKELAKIGDGGVGAGQSYSATTETKIITLEQSTVYYLRVSNGDDFGVEFNLTVASISQSSPSAIELTLGVKTSGAITVAGEGALFSFDAVDGHDYQIKWEDSFDEGNTSDYSIDVKVWVYRADGTTLYSYGTSVGSTSSGTFDGVDSGYDDPAYIKALGSEKVIIKVLEYYNNNTGTFALTVTEQ